MDHTTTLAGGCPILALDMYEHCYHIDYGARAGAYVDAFMATINWPNVACPSRTAFVSFWPQLTATALRSILVLAIVGMSSILRHRDEGFGCRCAAGLNPRHAADFEFGDNLVGDFLIKAGPVLAQAGTSASSVFRHRGSPQPAPRASLATLDLSRTTHPGELSLFVAGQRHGGGSLQLRSA